MLLTEKEAREKWCPHARIVRRESTDPGGPDMSDTAIVGGNNRDALGKCRNPASCRCIGAECMAWRWNQHPDFVEVGEAAVGYCGAFGRPIETPL